MQQFICVQGEPGQAIYQPLHGFTAVDLGYCTLGDLRIDQLIALVKKTALGDVG
jgi:hypothetical protein